MNILQVCPDQFTLTGGGGVSEHVRNISERLAAKHDVTIYALKNSKELPRYEMINGVRVERFDYVANGFSMGMLSRMRRVKFDIVHGHGYHAFPLHFSAWAKCDRFVVTPHFHGVGHSPFTNPLIRILKPFGRTTLRKAEKIISVSAYERALICEHFAFCSAKTVVIPNGVSFAEFSNIRKRKIKNPLKSILYVGYLLDFKGAHYLVEVLPKLSDNVVLEIVGKGPLRPYLEKRARELKVDDRVRFYENLPRSELVQKFVDADLLAMLSKHEAYSMVVAEALTAGTPCVVANASALSEWVDNETCVGVALPVNLNDLARKINYFLENDLDRHHMKKWVGNKIIDWDEVTHRLEAVYQQLLQ